MKLRSNVRIRQTANTKPRGFILTVEDQYSKNEIALTEFELVLVKKVIINQLNSLQTKNKRNKEIDCPSPRNPCMCFCHLTEECWDCRMGRHKPKIKSLQTKKGVNRKSK